ncbi:unnamed protein product [Auanema sp. JU1783]|nr:unnamed protein product [Auanema sp. JU1783]
MILVLLTIFLGWVLFDQFYWRRRHLPPGPIPLPIVGNLHTLLRFEPGYAAFEKWSKEYGPVYTFWLGSKAMVMITDYEIIKETFIRNGDDFADKYDFGEMTTEYRGGKYGVVDTNGDFWRDHRRFTLHQLRDLGLGKNAMEERVLIEVEELTKSLLQKKNGRVEKMQDIIDIGVGSIINQLLFGYRFDENCRDEFMTLKDLLSDQMRLFGKPQFLVISAFPKVAKLPYFKGMMDEVLLGRDKIFEFLNKQIAAHMEDMKNRDSEEPTDFTEAFLEERKNREKKGDFSSFCHLQLLNMCFDLWTAGMETTSNTLTWCLVYVMNHPDVQKKMHEEMDKIIGSDRVITMSDKNQLPYVNAVINETQRLANLLPINLMHLVRKDCVMNGHSVKAGSGIIAQISSVLYDEKIFPEPYKFKPERFIDEQCLGEGLARMELFLFAANAFNRFKFEPDGEVPTMRKVFGTTVAPLASNCRAVYRF